MTNGGFNVAAVQMLSFEGEPKRNLERMLLRIDEAAKAGSSLVVFPEASNNGYFFEDRKDAYEKTSLIPGPFIDALGKSARKDGIWVVTGMFEQGEGDDVFNCAVLIGPNGEVAGKYQKNFFIKADKRWFVPGQTGFKTLDTPLGNLGFFVCADGRIPESARCLAVGGAEILVNPTNCGASAEIASSSANGPSTTLHSVRAAEPRVELARHLLQPVGDAADFAGEAVVGALDLAEPAAAQQQAPLRQVGPVDQEDVDPGPVEQAGGQVLGLQRLVVEEAVDVEVVDREVRARLDGTRQKAGRGDIDDAIDDEVAVVVGKPPHPSVRPFEAPACRKRGYFAGEVPGELGSSERFATEGLSKRYSARGVRCPVRENAFPPTPAHQ